MLCDDTERWNWWGEGWEVGSAGVGKGRWEKLLRISSWKVYFGMISLCNREQIEVLKS